MDHRTIKHLLFFLLFLSPFFSVAQNNFTLSYPVCSPFAQFYNKDTINIITFGASTVQGVPAPYNFQTPLRLFLQNCYAGKTVLVTNRGIAGQTTADGLLRFEDAVKGNQGFILILMGANDAIRITDGTGSVNTTVSNMRQMIDRALAEKLDPILGTIQFFDQTRGDQRQRQLARQRNIIINQINNGYRNLARQKGIRLADLNATIGRDPSVYSDMIHPNARGYEMMSYVWFDAINQEIEQNFLNPGTVQNFPNPAKNYTRIGYTLAESGTVRIEVFDMNGRPAFPLVELFRNAGYHEDELNTSTLAPGIYVIGIRIGQKRYTKKMTVTR